jgi:DNA transformation protein
MRRPTDLAAKESDNACPGFVRASDILTGPIEELRNVGPKSSQWLRDVGIFTIDDLRKLGPVAVWHLVREPQEGVTINLLFALAAGLKGQDWRQLPNAVRQKLQSEAAQE